MSLKRSKLTEHCSFVADVAVQNAIKLQELFERLFGAQATNMDSEYLQKTFAFINWTFVQGVWSNISSTRLHRDLLREFRDVFILRLAGELAKEKTDGAVAAKAVFLTEELNSYLLSYAAAMQEAGYADSGTARLFALEHIQERFHIDDYIMNLLVPDLWADEGVNSEVESVAVKMNEAFVESKSKEFFARIFGK